MWMQRNWLAQVGFRECRHIVQVGWWPHGGKSYCPFMLGQLAHVLTFPSVNLCACQKATWSVLTWQSLEFNCPRKSGSMNAVDLSGLFKFSFYQEISVFAQQESRKREWKENMKELQIMLTQKSQVKNYYDILKVFPPTSTFISSLTCKPIKHMDTEG